MKGFSFSRWLAVCTITAVLLCRKTASAQGQNVSILDFGARHLQDSTRFIFTFSQPINISETTPCFLNKLIFLTGSNRSDPSVIRYRPLFNGSCSSPQSSSPIINANLDPRDFVAALEAGIFEVPLSIYTAVVDGLEWNFLPSINLVSITNPIPIGTFTQNTNRPIMTSFDIDLSTSIVRFHFNSIMDLSTFSSPSLTLTNGEATLILDRTSRPIGIETNLVKTVCVTLSDNDARELWRLGICTEPYGRCSCYFTADLMSDYNANTIEDMGSQNPIQVNKVQLAPTQIPDVYMQLELTYIGCRGYRNLTTDEVYIVRETEYVTRISCHAMGEVDNSTLQITFGGQGIERSDGGRATWLQFPVGLGEGDYGLYTCRTIQREILHYIVDNESPFIALPEGMEYTSRLYDSLTIPFFFGSIPPVNISDPGVEIILSGDGSFPDPVYRVVSPYKREVYYPLAPNSIDRTYRVQVLIGRDIVIESGVISIFITPPSVEVTPSAVALLPSDTQVNLTCVTNSPQLLIFWARYLPGNPSPAIVSISHNYTVPVPSQGGFRDETKFVCGVRNPENNDQSTDNSEQEAEAVVTNVPAPLSVFRNGEVVEDQEEIVIVNRLSGPLDLRCLGHAPSNVLGLEWVSDRKDGSRVILEPNGDEADIRVWYSYNEANITITNSNQPYRGTLRCQSTTAGIQRTVFVVAEASVGVPQTCREGDIDDTYGISWGETNVGNRNAQPCPNLAGANVEGFETSGFAYRLCGEGGQWEESVDVTNCLSDSFVDLKNAADNLIAMFDSLTSEEKRTQITRLTMTIKNASSPRDTGLFPQELNTSNYVVQDIIERLDENSDEMAVYNVADTLNNLLDESNIEEWTQLNMLSANGGGMNGGLFLLSNLKMFGEYLRTDRLDGNTMEITMERDNFNTYVSRYDAPPTEDILFPNSSLSVSEEAQVCIPASILMEKEVTGLVNIGIKNLQDFLPQPPNEVNSTKVTRLGSTVLSVQMYSPVSIPGDFTSGVVKFSYTTNTLIRISNPVCVFWNEVSSEWDTAGVDTAAIIKGEIGESKTFDVECESVHLTVFGVIVDQETETFSFTVPIYIGCGLIILSALMSTFSLLFSCILDKLRKFSVSVYFTHMSFCVALICAFVALLSGVELALQDMIGCVATATIIQYFFTAAFTWLLCESLTLVFFSWMSRNYLSFILLFLIGWGLPLFPTVIPAGFLRNEYGSTFHCWFFFDGELSGVFLTFLVPKLIIIALTIIFLMAAICTTCSRSRELVKGQSKVHVYMLGFMWCGILLLLLLLSVNWVFAMLHVNVYSGLDFSLTGWVFMGMAIALAVWMFVFTAGVVIFTQKVDYEILWEAVDGNQTVDRRKLKEKSATGYSLSGGSYPMRGLPPYDSPGNAGYGLSPDSTATFLGTGKTNPFTESEEERKIDY